MIEFKEGFMIVDHEDGPIEFYSYKTEVSYLSFGERIRFLLNSIKYDCVALFTLDVNEKTICLELRRGYRVDFENYCLSSVSKEYLINEIVEILEARGDYMDTKFAEIIREVFLI